MNGAAGFKGGDAKGKVRGDTEVGKAEQVSARVNDGDLIKEPAGGEEDIKSEQDLETSLEACPCLRTGKRIGEADMLESPDDRRCDSLPPQLLRSPSDRDRSSSDPPWCTPPIPLPEIDFFRSVWRLFWNQICTARTLIPSRSPNSCRVAASGSRFLAKASSRISSSSRLVLLLLLRGCPVGDVLKCEGTALTQLSVFLGAPDAVLSNGWNNCWCCL